MAGNLTRKMYDPCAAEQDARQSTDQLELIMDVNKYVNCNNICKPNSINNPIRPTSALLVDVESSLWGIDRIASDCDKSKYPFCASSGCLLNSDPRIPQHITPYACERGRCGDRAVITTNIPKLNSTGIRLPNPNICNNQSNGNGRISLINQRDVRRNAIAEQMGTNCLPRSMTQA